MEFTDDDCSNGIECGEPGNYESEVVEVKEQLTKNNDEMWCLEFKDVETGETICFDNLVFSKKAAGIAFTKIKNLGVNKNEEGKYRCDSQDLIGLRTNLTLKVKTYKDVDSLTPDFNAENFGYKMDEANSDLPF